MLKVTTRNSVYIVDNRADGTGRVTSIPVGDLRPVHWRILNEDPEVVFPIQVGSVMCGNSWHSSTVLQIEQA